MIVIIDNYDSFTYNLVQYYKQIHTDVIVFRNDAITVAQLKDLHPTLIVLSPGPGSPTDSGICKEILQTFYQDTPIFGVCLGMQIIVEFFDGKIVPSANPVHGMTSMITHTNHGVFNGLPQSFNVTRYHSLIADKNSLSKLDISAHTEDDLIMAVKHPTYPIEGVQFHPEAILTEYGFELIKNSLSLQLHPIIRKEEKN